MSWETKPSYYERREHEQRMAELTTRLRAELDEAVGLLDRVHNRASLIGQCYMADDEMRDVGKWLAKQKETDG